MSTLQNYWDVFGADYVAARNKFLTAAHNAGATLTSYLHPTEYGPNGESLYIDVAHLGDPHAPQALLAISGTHGLEGIAGSAVQVAWLRSDQAKLLPADVSAVLVHGLNPYGFAHGSRTTENNVDLNRNFIDHRAAHPENTHYATLHPFLIPEEWSEEALAKAAIAIEAFRDTHGPDALFEVTARGQYTHPDGTIYGGNGPEWSNNILFDIVDTHLSEAERVGLIDWHTGIGEYGEPFFLCFNAEDSPEQYQAALWWGKDRVLNQRPHGLARPNYQGLVFRGVEQFLSGRKVSGAVIEFGTRGLHMRSALRLDQWLRFKAPKHPQPERDAMLHADVIDAFVPTSSVWRRSVLEHGLQITQQAVIGLANWK